MCVCVFGFRLIFFSVFIHFAIIFPHNVCVYCQSECFALVSSRQCWEIFYWYYFTPLHFLPLEIVKMINHQIKLIHFRGVLVCIDALGKRKVGGQKRKQKSINEKYWNISLETAFFFAADFSLAALFQAYKSYSKANPIARRFIKFCYVREIFLRFIKIRVEFWKEMK